MPRLADADFDASSTPLRVRSRGLTIAAATLLAGASVAIALPPLSSVLVAAAQDTERPVQPDGESATDRTRAPDPVHPAPTPAAAIERVVASNTHASSGEAERPSDPTPADPVQPVRTFPLEDILPKREIGASDFVADNPTFDGRGTIVAIFDTGVDPGAPGLQVTTDGKPKVIDVIDGTGSGDVDTSTPVAVSEDRTVTGLTGRTLTIPGDWNVPSGEVRLGMKPAYELFPPGIVGRVRAERDEDLREQSLNRLLVDLRKRLAAWDREHPKPTHAQLREREELAARVAQAEKLGSMTDPGPVFDAVVFHDGETWRAALDTDEDGDLADETVLTNFRDERRYATFADDEHLLNYVLNIYEDGDLLSVVMDVGAHGTHVAGIAAANYPDQPEKNGVAPGAQIVSVKIGDTRSGGGSTGTGTVRGLIACIELGVDVVNMSYGGATAFPNEGRLNRLYREAVHDHNIVFLASAGNSGPALTTVGAPGGTSDWTIGVGATVTPAMMASMHQVRRPYDALQYTWSSRGPTSDGSLGVDITAPGGAISPVPTWYHRGTMMMNGTSMSSPNAAGGVALLISALKQNGLDFSSQCIKRAIMNSAEPIPGEEPWGEGAGMLRVDRAWQYLYATNARSDRDVFYDVSLPELDGVRGVYLREPAEVRGAAEPYVTIRPRFPDEYDPRRMVDFELLARLEPTADWVEAPEHALISTGGDGFRFFIDPTQLSPGAHYAELQGFDDTDPDAGPLFRVPVTVVKPLEVEADAGFTHSETLSFVPGRIERRFFAVPMGATYADLKIRRLDEDTPSTVVVHMVQLHDDESPNETNLRNYVRFDEADEEVRSIAVIGGGTLEVTLAQFWGSQNEQGRFSVELGFHGILPDSGDETLLLNPNAEFTTTHVTATLRDESISPTARLTHRLRTTAPKAAEVRPLPDAGRDEWPGQRRIHEAVVTYELSIPHDGRYNIYDAWFPGVRDYSSGLVEVFDENDRPVGLGGWWRTLSLDEGEYTVRIHYRHDDVGELERVKGTPLHVRERLASPVGLRVHHHPDLAWKGRGEHGARDLAAGERRAVHIANPQHGDYPKGAEPGDLLVGTIAYGRRGADFTGAGRRPGGFPIAYRVEPKPGNLDPEPEATDLATDEELSPEQELRRDIVEAKLKRLGTLDDSEEDAALFERLVAEIRAEVDEEPSEMERRRTRLALLEAELDRAVKFHGENEPQRVVEAAETVIAAIDADDIAAHLALDHDPSDASATKKSDRLKNERTILIDALHRKARALYHLAEPEEHAAADSASDDGAATNEADAAAAATDDERDEAGSMDTTPDAAEQTDQADGQESQPASADEASLSPEERFDRAFRELDRWVDTTGDEYVELHLDREVMRGRYAVALTLVNQRLADGPADASMLERRITLVEKLGWTRLADRERNRKLVEVREAGLPRI